MRSQRCKDGEGYSMFGLPIWFLNIFWFGLHSAKVWMKVDWLHTPSKIQSHGFKFQWKRQKYKKSHYYWEKETQESKHSLHLIWTLQVNQTHSVILVLIFFICLYVFNGVNYIWLQVLQDCWMLGNLLRNFQACLRHYHKVSPYPESTNMYTFFDCF